MKHHLQFATVQKEDFSLGSVPESPRPRFRPKPLSREQWKQLKIDRRNAERKQIEGIESQDIHKLCIEGKLIKAGAKEHFGQRGEKTFENFLRCGREEFYLMCGICEDGHSAFYQCSNKWCPRCNWRISMKRRELLTQMTKGIYSVKHVVLTQRNFEKLDREKIIASAKNLFALRRQKIFGKVTGGCASLEFTNEGRGWHMHWHLLIQSNFISGKELSVAWGKLVGQEFAIVKVMDVDEKSYLQEICKYVVEGSELAKWKPEKILEFVSALYRTRCFTTFGTFRAMKKFAELEIIRTAEPKKPCNCGCSEYVFGNDRQHCQRVAKKMGY